MKNLKHIALFTVSFLISQAQGTFRSKSDGHLQLGYNSSLANWSDHKAICFGKSSAPTTALHYGSWAISHWDAGLQFHKPNYSTSTGIYKFAIMDNGQVGINMKPGSKSSFSYLSLPTTFQPLSPFVYLWVGGLAVSDGWITFSDSTIKENIVKVENSLTEVLKLRPIKYNYIADRILGDTIPKDTNGVDDELSKSMLSSPPLLTNNLTKHFGLTAQELEAVFPDLVIDLGNVKGINYVELVPILINAIQEQQKQIADQNEMILLIKNLTPSSTTKSVLYQNDPNPFDVNTTFKYYIDETISVSNCSIEVRDLTGVLKSTIPLADQSGIGQTSYSFSSLNAGYYVYTLKVNGAAKDSKMLLIER